MFVVRLMDTDSTRSSKRREVVAEEGVAVRQEVCLCDNTHSRHRHSSSMKWKSRDWARALSQERLWRYGSFGTIRFRCERRTRMQLHWVRGCWAGGGGRAGRGAVRREVLLAAARETRRKRGDETCEWARFVVKMGQ